MLFSIRQIILNKIFHKNIKEQQLFFNIDINSKCLLSTKSTYSRVIMK